jgi:hypothetical protein
MGTVDKVVRILAAVLIVVLYLNLVISGTLAIILLAVAGIFVATSFIGVCPLYSALGIRTSKKAPKEIHKV